MLCDSCVGCARVPSEFLVCIFIGVCMCPCLSEDSPSDTSSGGFFGISLWLDISSSCLDWLTSELQRLTCPQQPSHYLWGHNTGWGNSFPKGLENPTQGLTLVRLFIACHLPPSSMSLTVSQVW